MQGSARAMGASQIAAPTAGPCAGRNQWDIKGRREGEEHRRQTTGVRGQVDGVSRCNSRFGLELVRRNASPDPSGGGLWESIRTQEPSRSLQEPSGIRSPGGAVFDMAPTFDQRGTVRVPWALAALLPVSMPLSSRRQNGPRAGLPAIHTQRCSGDSLTAPSSLPLPGMSH